MKAFTITYKEPHIDLLRGAVFDAESKQDALNKFSAYCAARNITPMFDNIKQLSDSEQLLHDEMRQNNNNTMGD